MTRSTSTSERFHVAILGTGIGGTILAAILARQGLRVLLVEQGIHPRFAIGESTIPYTTLLFRLLAVRYDVPEIAYLSNHQSASRYVSSNCGVKRNFSFVYHRPGEAQVPAETTQFPTAAPPLGPDLHLFRQDVDAFMLSTAAAYGAVVRQRTNVVDVDIDTHGVVLRAANGDAFEANYVVDAGGVRSLLAERFGLREQPSPLRTRSRSMYTHMIGVTPYDALIDRRAHGLPSPLGQGTLHHLFPGGWMWVIPFNNHPRSTNPLVSVGLNLDLERHPARGLPPEQEFWSFISAYPQIARQFEGATAIRDWVAADRLQFSSTRVVGDRYCLLPHAASFVDPLFSSGLGITMASINLLADRLLGAAVDGDYSAQRFEAVDTWTRWNFEFFDRLVANSYTSFDSFALWNAWGRVWMLGGLYGAMTVVELFQRYERSADRSALKVCDEFPYRGIHGSELPEFMELFDASDRELEAYRKGALTDTEAARNIVRHMDESGQWPGPWGTMATEPRHPGTFRLRDILKTGTWLKKNGRENVRKYFFQTTSNRAAAALVLREVKAELRHTMRAFGVLVRDFVLDWNADTAAPKQLVTEHHRHSRPLAAPALAHAARPDDPDVHDPPEGPRQPRAAMARASAQ